MLVGFWLVGLLGLVGFWFVEGWLIFVSIKSQA